MIDESGSIRDDVPNWTNSLIGTSQDNWYQITQFIEKLVNVLTISNQYSQVHKSKTKATLRNNYLLCSFLKSV